MRAPSTPRLALARDLMRCAMLEVDDIRSRMERLSLKVYQMDDPFFEEHFLAVIDEREMLFTIRDQRKGATR